MGRDFMISTRADIPLLQGKIFVRSDSKIFRFQNGKSESLFLQRKNPRKIAWTVLCRRQRRKGISEVRSHEYCRRSTSLGHHTHNHHRRPPSPAAVARSSPSVPSLVLPSTSSRSAALSAPRPARLPARPPSRRARRSALPPRALRRLRRPSPPQRAPLARPPAGTSPIRSMRHTDHGRNTNISRSVVGKQGAKGAASKPKPTSR